ncbi:hypothetical protein EVAR_45084_1 [Eumeta japonica]|uniref:Uncharacterized protein n=1 Tax=Eumeta variegata TaxID=151549 RepID=A0A4C1YF48_EUMVA|nr:hypothetical protein EVAR_45084_1 [Eumeta japonica]
MNWFASHKKRQKGRPLTRWMDDIKAKPPAKWMRTAKDREEWRKMEEAFANKWHTDRAASAGAIGWPAARPSTYASAVLRRFLKSDAQKANGTSPPAGTRSPFVLRLRYISGPARTLAISEKSPVRRSSLGYEQNIYLTEGKGANGGGSGVGEKKMGWMVGEIKKWPDYVRRSEQFVTLSRIKSDLHVAALLTVFG